MAISPTSPTDRFPWRPRAVDVVKIMGLFALTRILLVVVGVLSWSYQLPRSHWRGVDRPSGIRYAVVPDQPLLDMWTRWDSWQYEEIARKGYYYDFEAKPQPYGTVACFPFYPLVVRALGMILGGQYVVAGLLVSNVSAIIGFVLLFQWASWWGDRRAAWWAVASAITFPAGLFWSALYPQSLFFALSIGSLTLMLDGRAAAACLVAAAATATRTEGVALIPALLAIQFLRNGGRIDRQSLWLILTPLGLLGYMAYLEWRWGDPVLFLKVQTLFGRKLTNPLLTLIEPWKRRGGINDFTVPGTYATGLLLLLGHRARLRWPILLYGWLMFLIPLVSGVYISIYRVHLVNAPIYLAFGLGLRGRWQILAWGWVIVAEAYQGLLMYLWVVGYYLP